MAKLAKIRVVIADDHAVLRAGLKLLVHTQTDMEVVGEAGSFAEALAQTQEKRPDVLTLDLSMPDGQGLRAIEDLRAKCPRTRILVVTMHDDPAYLRTALAAGACGYVVKKAADTDLLTAIRTVAEGRTFVVFDQGNDEVTESPPAADQGTKARLENLSAREREVLQLLAEGHTNQAIADRLFLSVKSIESYRSRLMGKLNLKTRVELVRLAIEAGLLSNKAAGGDES